MRKPPPPELGGVQHAARISHLAEKIVQSFVISRVEPEIALSAVVTALGGIINWAFQVALSEQDFNDFKGQVLQALDHMIKKVAAAKYKGAQDARSSQDDPGAEGRDGETGGTSDVPVSQGNDQPGGPGENPDPTVARDVSGSGGGDKVH